MGRKQVLKLVALLSCCWVIYANMDLLDGAAEAVRKTNREVEVKLAMQQIGVALRAHYVDAQKLPTDLSAMLKMGLQADGRKITVDPGKDKWGVAYAMVPCSDGVYLVSAGPDMKWRTPDDIKFHQTLSDLGFRGPSGKRQATSGARSSSGQRPAAPQRRPPAPQRRQQQPLRAR